MKCNLYPYVAPRASIISLPHRYNLLTSLSKPANIEGEFDDFDNLDEWLGE